MEIPQDSIVWSGQQFLLKDFLENFQLPQIIKVEEGYHGEYEDDRTLSSSQLLILHTIKELATVKATVESSLEVILPADSKSKVSIVSGMDKARHFDSVEDLANCFPRFAVSVNSLTCFDIFENEVFELKKKTKKGREKYLVCNILYKTRTVELPFSFKGQFKSLGNCPVMSSTLQDVIVHCELPCTVKFMDNKLKLLRDNLDHPSGLNSVGPVKLQSVNQYKVVFTTTWEDQNASSVLPLPIDLEIRVVAALGAIQNDKNYSKLCKIAQNKTKSDQLILKSITHGPCKVLMEDFKDDNHCDQYADVGPELPPRNFKCSERKAAPGPKTRSIGVSGVPTNIKCPPNTAIKTKDNAFDEESFILMQKGGRTQSFSLHLENLPPSSVEEEFNATCNPIMSSESHSQLRRSRKHFEKLFHPLIKVPTKVVSEVQKRIQPRLSQSGLPSTGALSRTIVEDSEYQKVITPPGSCADRLNPAFQSKVVDNPVEDSKHKLNIENPDNITTWSMRDVAEVLKFCHLEMYIEKCKEEKIDGALLSVLDADALISLGIQNPLHLQKLLKIIGGWLPKL